MTDQQLLDAARHGETGKLREYLEGGADVNTKNENGWTLLVSEKRFAYKALGIILTLLTYRFIRLEALGRSYWASRDGSLAVGKGSSG